jgi:hypothetical protein
MFEGKDPTGKSLEAVLSLGADVRGKIGGFHSSDD